MSQKTLYILRHAKAETGAAGQDDHDRALTERGIEAASAMGHYMLQRGIHPSKILCSTALRARQTLEQILPSILANGQSEVGYNDKLYLASANEMVNILADMPSQLQ